MLPVARLSDVFVDTDIIATGSGDVFINGLPCARLTDITTGHTIPQHTFYAPTVISSGSGSVFVNGLPIARLSDTKIGHFDTPHPVPDFHTSVIASGSGDVFSG